MILSKIGITSFIKRWQQPAETLLGDLLYLALIGVIQVGIGFYLCCWWLLSSFPRLIMVGGLGLLLSYLVM